MKYLHQLLLLTMLTGLLTLPSIAQDDANSADLIDETILMTFVPNIQFAPMYVAMEGGYFAEQGLDVSLEYLNEPDVIDLVAADQNQFGIVSGEQVILAAAQGRPVRYVYEWFQEYPIGIVYNADREVESITDLTTVTLGIPGRFGASYSGLTTLLDAADLQESDIALEEIGFAAPEVFCIGAVEASVVYVNNEPLQIQNRADAGDCGNVEEVAVLSVAEEVDLVSNGIITNQMAIEENPERVQAVVDAYHAGLQVTIENPARAYLLSAPLIENLPLSEELRAALEDIAEEQEAFLETDYTTDDLYARHQAMLATLAEDFTPDELIQLEVLVTSIPLFDAERLGYTDAASWQNMQETLLSLGTLDAAVDVGTLYTNDFVPQAATESTAEPESEGDDS